MHTLFLKNNTISDTFQEWYNPLHTCIALYILVSRNSRFQKDKTPINPRSTSNWVVIYQKCMWDNTISWQLNIYSPEYFCCLSHIGNLLVDSDEADNISGMLQNV